VRFFVRDEGAGMTEAEIATLFTKFTRLESARTGNIRGTGLGLAVCRLLAGKMGGRVGVDSKPGEGSNFWAEIPFVAMPEAAKAEAPRLPAGSPSRAHRRGHRLQRRRDAGDAAEARHPVGRRERRDRGAGRA
jgi:hypothetical protein